MGFNSANKKVPGEDAREFDTTSLRQRQHGHWVHRDYGAHFFRWGFVPRFIRTHKERVLDIGCGADQPLARVLNYKSYPALLVGVDYDKVKPRHNFAWLKIMPEFDFTRRWRELQKEHGTFDVVTCFEVIEHMHTDAGLRLLKGARELLSDDGVFLLSTPCYSGKRMAANHIHEYTVDELAKAIAKAGLKVEQRFGTFMTSLNVKKVKDQAHKATWEALTQYYDHEVLACFLAPLYPDLANNNLWVLRK